MINGPGNMQYAVAERQAQIGGDWFFWIAGLSLVNSVLGLIHSPIGSLFGLGTTDVIDAVGTSVGGSGRMISLGLDVLVAGVFAVFGVFARRGAKWAFITGAVFYLLDALVVLLLTRQYLEVAAHAYALYRIFQGFQGAQQMGLLRAQQSSAPYGGYVPPSTPTTDVWPPPPSA